MAYILDVINRTIEPTTDRISLERFVLENSYIIRYLSRIIKDKALIVYQVLFHLSWFETGKGEVIIPWAKVGSYITSEQGNILEDNTSVKRRLTDLLQKQCIAVKRQRGGANEISVFLPSDIAVCHKLIEEEKASQPELKSLDSRDYYTDSERRLHILKRDGYRCTYCRIEISDDSYVLDHLIPIINGGTNRKFNLVATCHKCNERKQDKEPFGLLLENYRNHLLSQDEYMKQKNYIETLLTEGKEII